MQKRGDGVEVGDIILFLGTPHRVDTIEPYTHPTIGEPWRIARASDGWAITLEPTVSLECV